jgi:hypothetical protein
VVRFALFPSSEYLKLSELKHQKLEGLSKFRKASMGPDVKPSGQFSSNSTREYSFAASPDAFPIFSFRKLVAILVARGDTYLHVQKKH